MSGSKIPTSAIKSPVWFITGASSGFGLHLSLLALSRGHRVIATSRNPARTPELVAKVEGLGGKWMPLDVTWEEAKIQATVNEALNIWRRVDILVNSAGYPLLGAFECFSEKEYRHQFETNFFGPLKLTQALIPHFRTQKSGTIVQISSTAGLEAKPSRSMYSASKFALEGMSEAISHEVSPLGIRTIIISPGAFGTNFADGLVLPEKEMPTEYQGTDLQRFVEMVEGMKTGGPGGGKQVVKMPGDVEKGVQAIFDVVMKTGQADGMEDFLRIPLGRDGIERWEIKLGELRKTIDGTEKIWSATDID